LEKDSELTIKLESKMKYQSVYNRLRRIEGQIRGIEEMIAKDRPEEELLMQLEAVKASIASSISSLVEKMIEDNNKSDAEIANRHLKTLLRLLKKT
jgi:DNA-binding FrmR family transcriptional regulator